MSVHALMRTMAQMNVRLDQNEQRIKSLEKKVKKVEAERDDYKARYSKALVTIREQAAQIKELTAKVDSYEKTLAWFRRDKFGRHSEADDIKEPQPDDQDQVKGKRKRGQQFGSKGHGRTKRTDLDQDEIILDIDNKACSSCLKPFKLLPETDNFTLAEIETLLYQVRYRRQRYARQCKCAGKKIITAPPAPRLYRRTTIGNSLWIHLCVQKFLHGMPTNRILKDLALRGLGISAGTVTDGYKVINDLLEPLYEAIKTFCQGENYWHADETSWRVFSDDNGKRNSKKWWLWVIAGQQAVTYILDKSRSRSVPEDFFAGSIGILMTDRYSAYKCLSAAIKKAWCWVHVRRDFIKLLAVPKFKKWAKNWLIEIAKLFVLNHARNFLWSAGKDSGSDWEQAQKALCDHTDLMQNNWRMELRKCLHKEQKTAMQSLKKHWDGLTLFLVDPRIPLDNNKAERLLRGCVIQRKNSYGNGVEWAGHLSAKFFTVFQTWLINGLDPQALLLDYFNQCSLHPGKPPPTVVNFLPWEMSQERKDDFCLPLSYKRPA